MFTTLVTISELTAHLDDPDWLVFDCRHDLADTAAGRRAYAHSHIPGARFVHLDDDLSGPKTGTNGRHPLPDPDKFCARLAALGMHNHRQAVAYDASGGVYAARLWWMLRWIGHARVAVLDGGWDAWLKAGASVTGQVATVTPAAFSGAPRDITVDASFILSRIGEPHTKVLDARSADAEAAFAGEF